MKNVKTPITALIVIIAILLLWNHGSKNSTAEQTQDQQAQAHDLFQRHARGNGAVALSNLRYAYTGNWQRNNITAQAEQFSFPTPAVVKAAAAAKKIAKKKAADAKKVAAKKQPTKYRYYTGPSPRSTSTDSNYTGASPNGLLNSAPPVTPLQSPDNDSKKSAQEYLKQILATKNISQLVSDYKSHKTDAATFYSVINALLSSGQTDPSVRVLAYQAMGQVSPSMQSFMIIANHQSTEAANVQPVAQADLRSYASINYVPILNSLLGNNNDAVRITAAQTIQQVVNQVLGIGTANNHGGTVTAQQYAQLFSTVLTNLNNLLQSGRLDAQVSSAFSSTRNTLQQFLG